MAVLLAKHALPRSLDRPPPEVAEDLARLPQGFGQQAFEGPGLNVKKLTKPPGAWRLRTGDWRCIFFPTAGDFLVAAIGLRKDIHSPAEELELLAALVQERLDAGTDPGDIAVLAEVGKKVDAAIADYEGEHADAVLVGTFSRAKGLEFKEVFIPGLAGAGWPSRWFLPPDLEGEAREERLAVQLRTLFVGMSRARDRLVLLSGGEPAEPIRGAEWALDVRRY